MTTAADPLQDHMDAVADLAHMIAGADEQRAMVVFHALANQVAGFVAGTGEDNFRLARTMLRRSSSPLIRSAVRHGADVSEDSIYSDPVYLANSRALIRDRSRIVGGVPTSDFPDCVAVGSESGWCCSGTLVAPNVVVTAAHCVEGGCAARVFVGEDVAYPADGEVIKVDTAVAHPGYGTHGAHSDIAVLILERDTDLPPRRLATADHLGGATFVRLAGYGNTDPFGSSGYGRRRMVDVPVAGNDPKYGSDPESEFVAGAPFLDRDSCNGDSGGPAYVQADGEWFLAGATSRATASSLRPCGDGGVYTRVDVYERWVRSVPGGRWA
jgi:secreted trypsin-like serine protease